MRGFSVSLIVGFILAYSSMWLVSRINDRYTRWEKNLCRVLAKRGKKDVGRNPASDWGIAVLETAKSWVLNPPRIFWGPQSFLQRGRAILSFFSGHPPISPFRAFYLGGVRLRNLLSPHIRKGACHMTAYEFYWKDQEGTEHFLGALPERRKNPERITEESIKTWGRLIIGEWAMMNNFYFVQVEV